jgi:ribosome-binding factor A
MSSPKRHERLNREILRELARLAQREIRDPRVGQVTFTRVELTEDLREARVFFVPLGGVGQEKRIAEMQVGLDAAKTFLQRKVGKNLKLRFTPRMTFRYDKGLGNLVRVHEVIGDLNSEAQDKGEQ